MLRLLPVALLLFGSGLCALVYQIAWAREFRLVFGGTTAASGAVLAIFMGGLGLGNALFGRVADRKSSPLRMYASLELAISLSVAISPWLTDLTRSLYIRLGGELTLGSVGATAVRLLFSLLVLGLPTCLMGGTLPAAVRAITTAEDRSRRGAGLVYGFNTLGAVAGAGLCTFLLLEQLGTRGALWTACGLNLLIAAGAFLLALRREKCDIQCAVPTLESDAAEPEVTKVLSPAFVYVAAGIAGLAFFLMEMVWFRMLGPLLGGNTYSLGIILVMALFGIGLGGALYPLGYRHREPGPVDLAWTCALEATAVIFPYAMGDRLAVLAARLAGVPHEGLWSHVLDWGIISGIVIFPAALVSGWQFPLLMALAGRGRSGVGKQVGLTFASNTVGAITGLLAGGFGIMSLLTTLGCWRGVTFLLIALCVVSVAISLRGNRWNWKTTASLVLCLVSAGMLQSEGPTAFWRHNPIGAGRAHMNDLSDNDLRLWQNSVRRMMMWEADGKEATVAISRQDSLAFLVNGKSDGNALLDLETQVMLGLVGCVLHPHPRDCLVVGLGTGQSAGWAAALSSVEHVDVVEIEPVVTEMARLCAPMNNNVLDNPKVHLIFNDAREVLLTTPRKYDVIVSEPSNLYRAGVPNLYTLEFYEAIRSRLKPGGVFVQWLQTYEGNPAAIHTVFTTLKTAFKHREAWGAMSGDVLLVCGDTPPKYTAAALRDRLQQPELRDILRRALYVQDLEGWLTLYLTGAAGLDAMAEQSGSERVNSDDLNVVEYGFARGFGMRGSSLAEFYRNSREKGFHRPQIEGTVDWDSVDSQYLSRLAISNTQITPFRDYSPELITRAKAYQAFVTGNMKGYLDLWDQQSRVARAPAELQLLTIASAYEKQERTGELVERLRATHPWEADALQGFWLQRRGQTAEARTQLNYSIRDLRTNPWPNTSVCAMTVDAALAIARDEPSPAGLRSFYDALSQPFAMYRYEEERLQMAYNIAASLRDPPLIVQAVTPFEPYIPWNEAFLKTREDAYRKTDHPLASRALKDLEQFRKQSKKK